MAVETTQQDGDTSSERNTPVSGTLGLLWDIEVPISIRLGSTKMLLGDVARLTVGSSVDLGQREDGRVDVVVNGRVVARGELVLVDGNCGVTISEIVSTNAPTRF